MDQMWEEAADEDQEVKTIGKLSCKNSSYSLMMLESAIMVQVTRNEKKEIENNPILISITEDLENLYDNLNQSIQAKNIQEILKIRMHQLAISKILVFTHGKSDFRLVVAHFRIGEAYLQYGCHDQAIDHLTVAIKKNGKMGDIKETKLFHSYIMTTLSKCYFELKSYEDCLEILNRAYDIQQTFMNTFKKTCNNVETVELISMCYFKLKNFKSLLEFIDKSIESLRKAENCEFSDDIVEKIIEKSNILSYEGNHQGSIEQIKVAIDYYELKPVENQKKIIQAFRKIAVYLENYGDFDQQFKYMTKIEAYYERQQNSFTANNRNETLALLRTKRKIAKIYHSQSQISNAISKLEEVHAIEMMIFGEDSEAANKTLGLMAMILMNNGNEEQADKKMALITKTSHPEKPAIVRKLKKRVTGRTGQPGTADHWP